MIYGGIVNNEKICLPRKIQQMMMLEMLPDGELVPRNKPYGG
jgi:hypothetical protein